MSRTIRWGIWGTGAIANKVAADIPLATDCKLQAVASRNGERSRRFAVRHKATRWYDSREELLNDPEIDAVYIATPNHCHAQDSLAAIEAGKAVLCEKPFTLNAAQTQAVTDAARRRGVFCMEAMWTRFLPAVKEARRIVEAGEIGAVRFLKGNFAFPAPPKADSRLLDLAQGGGSTLDIGIYPISLAHYLLGVPTTIASQAIMGATGVDEQAAYLLTFAGGAIAELWSSLLVQGSNSFTIFGERGSIELCDPFFAAHRLILRRYERPPAEAASSTNKSRRAHWGIGTSAAVKWLHRRLAPWLSAFPNGQACNFPFAGNGYQFELMEVAACLREGRTESTILPLEDSIAMLRILDTLRAQWGMAFPQETNDGHADGARMSE